MQDAVRQDAEPIRIARCVFCKQKTTPTTSPKSPKGDREVVGDSLAPKSQGWDVDNFFLSQ